MANQWQQGLEATRHITFHDLDMEKVEHQFEIGLSHLADNVSRLPRAVQKISGRIIVVQGFDENCHVITSSITGIGEIVAKRAPRTRPAGISGHHMHGSG